MTTLTAPPAPPTDSLLFKPEPLSVADLGLDRGVVRDLTLKTLYYRGRMTRTALADELKLSQPVMEEVMSLLSQEGFVTVLGSEGSGAAAYTYSATQKGVERAEGMAHGTSWSARRASSRIRSSTRRLRPTRTSPVSMSTVRGRGSGTATSSRMRPGRAVMRASEAFDEMDNLKDERAAGLLKRVAQRLTDMAREVT